jgi:hypothetical protein
LTPDPVRRSGRRFLGYRAWTFDGYRLRSANPAGGHWVAGVNRAECRRLAYLRAMPGAVPWAPGLNARRDHTAPEPSCACGLYAWHDAGRLPRPPGWEAEWVYGAVLAWGTTEVHADGFRAELAEPVVLSYSDDQTHRHVRRVQAIASELGLPAVELERLEEAAAGLGEPVPEELRPHAPSPAEIGARWALGLAAGGALLAAAGIIGGARPRQRRPSAPDPPSRAAGGGESG